MDGRVADRSAAVGPTAHTTSERGGAVHGTQAPWHPGDSGATSARSSADESPEPAAGGGYAAWQFAHDTDVTARHRGLASPESSGWDCATSSIVTSSMVDLRFSPNGHLWSGAVRGGPGVSGIGYAPAGVVAIGRRARHRGAAGVESAVRPVEARRRAGMVDLAVPPPRMRRADRGEPAGE